MYFTTRYFITIIVHVICGPLDTLLLFHTIVEEYIAICKSSHWRSSCRTHSKFRKTSDQAHYYRASSFGQTEAARFP